MSNLPEIILHNYPQSPVAEKVRVGLGIKQLDWFSVEIPRLPPKPMLTKMTGGYRRTPVMQIGADLFCDSQCILKELDRRYPQRSFAPTADGGLLWALSRWVDGPLFDLGVKLVMGADPTKLDPAFAEDRGKLYLGPNWAESLQRAHSDLPHLFAQFRGPFTWLDDMLGDGRSFLSGSAPSALDAQIYCLVWFLRGRIEMGPPFLDSFSNLPNWEKRVQALGHGTPRDLSAEEALDHAAKAEPMETGGPDPADPQNLQIGALVAVKPDVESDEQAVDGIITGVSAERISLRRQDPDLGSLGVHFPRTGYKVVVQ